MGTTFGRLNSIIHLVKTQKWWLLGYAKVVNSSEYSKMVTTDDYSKV